MSSAETAQSLTISERGFRIAEIAPKNLRICFVGKLNNLKDEGLNMIEEFESQDRQFCILKSQI
jgi:hypothetical protein